MAPNICVFCCLRGLDAAIFLIFPIHLSFFNWSGPNPWWTRLRLCLLQHIFRDWERVPGGRCWPSWLRKIVPGIRLARRHGERKRIRCSSGILRHALPILKHCIRGSMQVVHFSGKNVFQKSKLIASITITKMFVTHNSKPVSTVIITDVCKNVLPVGP